MTKEMQDILQRAHDNGGMTRLKTKDEVQHLRHCVVAGYLLPEYDVLTPKPHRYLHHRLTERGRNHLMIVRGGGQLA